MNINKQIKGFTLALAAATVISSPVMASSSQAEAESPSFMAMTGDLLIARPLMLVTTIVGGAVFVVSSPFSAAGDNLDQAADTLVTKPFNATFKRCLGCAPKRDDGF